MEARAGKKLHVLVWLLALWLSVEASGKGGGGKGKGIRGNFGGQAIVQPLPQPIPPPKIHVNPVPVPVKPCYPITKQTTQFKILDNFVPVYQTQVQPVIVTTTLYRTSYITRGYEATSLLITTVRNTEFEYDNSVAYITHYKTVTSVLSVPVHTTITNIKYKEEPLVTTIARVVQEGAPQYFTDTLLVTHTKYNQPRVTVTKEFPYHFDNAHHQQVTETRYVTETALAQPLRVTSTVVKTGVSHTPVYITVTVTNTVPFTTTVQQQVPQIVTVKAPCGGGGKGGSINSYGPY